MTQSKALGRAARRKVTRRRPRTETPTQPQHDQDSKAVDQRMAVGALLAFYRRARGKNRADLIARVGISNPLLSRIEGGERLPTMDVLERLCDGLVLTPFERSQLRAVAGYERGSSPESTSLACDVLGGVPLFLRSPEDERELALHSDVSEIWIVSPSPLILATAFFNMLKTILLHSKYMTKYVWFVDKRTGASDASHVRELLDSDKDLSGKGIDWSEWIEFVLCPPALSIAGPRLGIYNPRDEQKRYGRAIYVSGGHPVGLYAMDNQFVGRITGFLTRMYDGCKSISDRSDPWFPQEAETAKESGTFRFLRLRHPPVIEESPINAL